LKIDWKIADSMDRHYLVSVYKVEKIGIK